MDRVRLLEVLSLPPMTRIDITHMTWQLWGQTMTFACEADAIQFSVQFEDCREMKWQLYTHMQHDEPLAFPRTEWVNFRMGRDQHRSPAHVLTQHFGLSLMYGALVMLHNENRLPIETT